MDKLKNLNNRLDSIRNALQGINKEDVNTTGIRFDKDKKILSKEEFYSNEFMRGYVRYDDPQDIQVGDFIRYKQKRESGVKYLWGGMVTFISPEFLRLKNVYTNAKWSVQLADPKVMNTFYVRRKMTLNDIEAFTDLCDDSKRLIDLNSASSIGLITEIINRGDKHLIVEAANVIRENNDETIIFATNDD
ncbi:hypothetical protein BST79_gp031 [Only Syngen Nebraska virus 5]|uniref:hypothetical protein n=1 Tax=Only Syngen Nebraska virus 5 TaxID=1917232 RepID=UPI000900C8D9|nr:hypothetical protein BST79_gp031 [Only Syngen Nebraska virus 5]APC25544.1 hypothetical protein [Only Syngen Nebraska virus 5]